MTYLFVATGKQIAEVSKIREICGVRGRRYWLAFLTDHRPRVDVQQQKLNYFEASWSARKMDHNLFGDIHVILFSLV